MEIVDTTAGPRTAEGHRKSLFSRVTLDTRPLGRAAFRRTLLGQGTSYIGTMVTQVAVPVQIYAISRSSLLVGLAGLAGLAPIVVFGLWGGVIADAYDRRRVCLAASLVTWTVTLLLLAQAVLDLVSVVYRQTILQTYAPDELRGRLQGVFTVVVSGGPRLGDLRAGAMAAGFGLTVAWSGAALVCIPVALLTAVAVRPFWRYRTADPAAGSPGHPADGREPGSPEGREPRSLDSAVP
jgi:MFS family permease